MRDFQLGKKFGETPDNYRDAVGQKFHHLTVIQHVKAVGIFCRCDCGEIKLLKSSYRLMCKKPVKSCGKCGLSGLRKWTNEEKAIIKLYAGVKTSQQIGEMMDPPRNSDQVKYQAGKLGVSLKMKGDTCPWSKYDDHDCELARQLHDEGVPLKTISEKLEIPYHATHAIVYHKRI